MPLLDAGAVVIGSVVIGGGAGVVGGAGAVGGGVGGGGRGATDDVGPPVAWPAGVWAGTEMIVTRLVTGSP
jgi:hypothetical protein